MGLPPGLVFRTKGQLAIDIAAEALADGIGLRFLLRGRGVRQLHRAAGVLRRPRPGLCAAGPADLSPDAGQRPAVTCARGRQPAGGHAALGGPLRRERVQGRALVCLVVAGYRLPAALPADPPPPEDR